MVSDKHKEVTELEKIQGLKYHVAGAFLTNVFAVLTFLGSVFVLFLDQLGLDKSRIGVILSIAPFCQIISIIAAPVVERAGFKRCFLAFYGFRAVVMSFLIATPFVLSRWGQQSAYMWVGGIMVAFSISRAIAETAVWPWNAEMIPNSIRGKFSAVNSIIATIGIIITIAAAGLVIGKFDGLNKFIWLIAIGTGAGFVSLVFYFKLPGGAPKKSEITYGDSFKAFKNVVSDANYLNFMAGYGLVALAVGSTVSFVPLYMNEQIGIGQGKVVWLDMGAYGGSILACYLWGWASDRFGAKPIIVSCLSAIIMAPVMWYFLPRNSSLSFRLALLVNFFLGSMNIGWAVGFGKYLFTNAVPSDKKTSYMAFFYAWAGLTAGLGPFIGGQILKLTADIEAKWYFFNFDQFTALFVFFIITLSIAVFFMSKIRADGAMATQSFVGMFFQGNPVTALGNVMRYHRGGTEDQRMRRTESLGKSKTLINVDELADALNDPSYNVRHEAVVAISKAPPHKKLIDSLCHILEDTQSDLSLSAAWALGKIGSEKAVESLRTALRSEYKLLRARSARSLAMLNDIESKDYMLEQLEIEDDPALKVAYCSALGNLGDERVLQQGRDLLRSSTSETSKRELTLTLARIAGQENRFIRHWRKINSEPATNTAQAVLNLRRELNERQSGDFAVRRTIVDCAEFYSRGDSKAGTKKICELAKMLEIASKLENINMIVTECVRALEEDPARLEYQILLIHCLHTGLRKTKKLAET
jgi:MFS family permease